MPLGRLSIFIRTMNAKGFPMSNNPNELELSLAHKALFSLPDAADVQIACLQGSLWLTLDDDPRDIILDAGDSFSTTDHRRALIYALEASSLRLSPAATTASVLRMESSRAAGLAGRAASLPALRPA